MKNFTSKLLTTVLFLSSICFVATGQTNVSGGIYADTTWTLANSPYIVVDTVVVFPGVTLTIEPGVVVKFADSTRMEIRQANIIANGTSSDSITFTSNSGTPFAGIWGEVKLNGNLSYNKHSFNYCNFRYAKSGIDKASGLTHDTLIIKNSNFNYNINGMYGGNGAFVFIDTSNFKYNTAFGYGLGQIVAQGILNYCEFSNDSIGLQISQYHTVKNCRIDSNIIGLNALTLCKLINCTIRHNQTGIITGGWNSISSSQIDSNITTGVKLAGGGVQNDSLINCQIRFNNIGVADYGWNHTNVVTKCVIENNDIGLHIEGIFDEIHCNRICNNTTFDFYYHGTPNFSAINNYWCSNDSATIRSHIYDGYVNITEGLVYITPFDTIGCYLSTGILNIEPEIYSVNLFPNPASNYLTIVQPINISNAEIKIFNLLGELEYSGTMTTQFKNIDITTFARGLKTIQITVEDKVSRQKFIKL